MDKLLTTYQAADILDISDRRVRALIKAKRLPAKKFGPAWMIQEKDLKKVKDRRPGRPKGKHSQASHVRAKRNDPDSLPVSKTSGRK